MLDEYLASYGYFVPLHDYYYFRCGAEAIREGTSLYGLQPMSDCLAQFDMGAAPPSLVFAPWGIWLVFLLGLGPLDLSSALLTAASFLAWWYALRSFCSLLDIKPALTRTLFFIGTTLAFPPFLKSVIYGQISVLLLFVFVGTLSMRTRRPWIAGCLYGVLMVKPQIFIPVIVGLVGVSSFSWSYRFLGGVCISLLGQLLISLLIYPQLLTDLANSADNFARTRYFPNVQYGVRFLSDGALGFNYAVYLLGSIAGGVVVWKKRAEWKSPELFLVVLSVSVCPYIWLHDLIFLLPVFMWMMGAIVGRSSGIWLLVTALSFLFFPRIMADPSLTEGAFCFMPVGALLCFFLGDTSFRQRLRVPVESIGV